MFVDPMTLRGLEELLRQDDSASPRIQKTQSAKIIRLVPAGRADAARKPEGAEASSLS